MADGAPWPGGDPADEAGVSARRLGDLDTVESSSLLCRRGFAMGIFIKGSDDPFPTHILLLHPRM